MSIWCMSVAAGMFRGLYHQGYSLHAGRDYNGYLAIRANSPVSVSVALEAWPVDTNPTVLAQQLLSHPGDGKWQIINFTLIPNASALCAPFPFDTSPLDCSIPDSQKMRPDSATGTCERCTGTLTVSIDAGTAVIDQVVHATNRFRLTVHQQMPVDRLADYCR